MLAHRVMMGGRHAYADEVIADAPLAYWRLDETSGTTANDAIGSNHGTYTGGVTLNQPGIPSTGRPSVSLNGSSGYVNIPHHASLSITGDLTVEAWVYRSSAAGFRGGIAKRVGGNPCEFGLNFNQATPVTQWYFHDGTNFRMCSFAGLPAQDAWTHVVGTRQGGVCALYFNGVQVATANLSAFTPAATTRPVTIGTDDGLGFMAGRPDEVAIYAHALSATRVLAHYDAGI